MINGTASISRSSFCRLSIVAGLDRSRVSPPVSFRGALPSRTARPPTHVSREAATARGNKEHCRLIPHTHTHPPLRMRLPARSHGSTAGPPSPSSFFPQARPTWPSGIAGLAGRASACSRPSAAPASPLQQPFPTAPEKRLPADNGCIGCCGRPVRVRPLARRGGQHAPRPGPEESIATAAAAAAVHLCDALLFRAGPTFETAAGVSELPAVSLRRSAATRTPAGRWSVGLELVPSWTQRHSLNAPASPHMTAYLF